MGLLSTLLVGLVAVLHLGFLVLEMFFWNKPLGRKIFGLSPELAEGSAPLAANQGLYNGFLAAGLIWSLTGPVGAFGIKVFFLTCVLIAGVFGAITAKRSILYVQAMPAALALVVTFLAYR
jgi:Predicted membrane protein